MPGASIAQLEANGVVTVIGTVVNPAGLTHVKAVPIRRAMTFAEPGLGASPVWHAFAVDQTGIAFSEDIGVVGDERIRIDLNALHGIGDGLAWAPGGFFDQDGNEVPACSRGTLTRVTARLADAGLNALVGHEIEFVLVAPDGSRLPPGPWAQYGLAGLLDREEFVHDVLSSASKAGIGIEQFHPEYGQNQFELSLRPQPPVAAADHLVLMRILIGRLARRYGMGVSMSPVPFFGSVGSGAHQHFSLWRAGVPLFSGGPGPHRMTSEGQAAIAGVLAGLPEAQAILSGSIVSGLRMQPGHWAGAHVCWGAENREAAVRFLVGGPANPYGANAEVKVVDPSSNPYYATAVILALALDGIERAATLPPETTIDPALQSEAQRAAAGTRRLPDRQPDILAALDDSGLIRRLLGPQPVAVTLGVRRYEQEHYGDLPPDALCDRFRMAWSL